MNLHRLVLTTCIMFSLCLSSRAAWQPAKGPLMTRWAKEVSPQNAHPEYPRPQMVRKNWFNLNGLWDYAIRPKGEERPATFDGKILVPFPIESALSGVMKRVGESNRLWYRRTFGVPRAWEDHRVLLHFGAVDWDTTVWVNDKQVGTHRGGYDPFTFDITDALKSGGTQEIVLAVWDPTSRGYQARGKQVDRPGGIWYTPSTGIWQTAWLEPVPAAHIRSLKIAPDVDRSEVRIVVNASKVGERTTFKATSGDLSSVATSDPHTLVIKVPNPKLWSPDSPHLYDLRVSMLEGGKVADRVSSYFGMRKVSLGKDEGGITRIFFNDKPLFMFGPLDQGFWPDGLYMAPTDEALRYDIEVTRRLGFNMCRKHVKIEPLRWYYWADRLGLIVWQDMPSANRGVRRGNRDIPRPKELDEQFERELKAMVESHYNNPSIVMWVPYNEGWGQYDTERLVQNIKQWDPTRLVDCASGWSDKGVGDVHDIHSYPGPAATQPEPNRAAVLGEFGGLGLPLGGHTWQDEKNWGYRSFKDRESLTEAYIGLLHRLRSLIGSPGLSAAVYTQTTDVEIEVNGLMTYDRAIIKKDVDRIVPTNHKMYLPPPIVKTIVPTSQVKGITWRYTTDKPGDGWHKPDFDDSSWKEGPGGFGRKDTPGAVVRTPWESADIWIRRTFELGEDLKMEDPYLLIHHDEDAEVYINGEPAAKLTGYTADYVTAPLSDKARAALKPGKNTLAVHCKQTQGGQYIDLGLVNVIERPAE